MITIEIVATLALFTIIALAAIAIYIVHTSGDTKVITEDVKPPDDIITTTVQNRSRKIKLAGVRMSVGRYYQIMVIAAIAFFAFALYTSQNIIFAIMISVVGCVVPNIIINFLRARENKKFSENFQKALEVMSTSLKAGGTIKKAVRDVLDSQFIPSSIKTHFRRIEAQMDMGVSIADAFRNFAEETDNYYVKEASVAIDVQTTIGNREDVVIKSISTNILDELILNKKVNAAFATTSSMVRLMDFLPTLVYIFFTLTSRSYVDVYFSSPLMMGVYAFLFVIPLFGSFITHRMLRKVRKQI